MTGLLFWFTGLLLSLLVAFAPLFAIEQQRISLLTQPKENYRVAFLEYADIVRRVVKRVQNGKLVIFNETAANAFHVDAGFQSGEAPGEELAIKLSSFNPVKEKGLLGRNIVQDMRLGNALIKDDKGRWKLYIWANPQNRDADSELRRVFGMDEMRAHYIRQGNTLYGEGADDLPLPELLINSIPENAIVLVSNPVESGPKTFKAGTESSENGDDTEGEVS